MSRPGTQTDERLLAIDLPAVIAAGLVSSGVDGAATVAAAVRADLLGVYPRSLTFLAEIVRRGGISYAAALPLPLPTAEQSALVADWLGAASPTGADVTFARWLDAVAAVLGARRAARVSGP